MIANNKRKNYLLFTIKINGSVTKEEGEHLKMKWLKNYVSGLKVVDFSK